MSNQQWRVLELSRITPPDAPIVYGIVQAGEHIECGIPYIRSTDVGARIDHLQLLRTSKEIAKKYRRSTVLENDIVISLRGNTGETSLIEANLSGANLTQGTARIRASADHDPRYIRQALQSANSQRWLQRISKGSALKEISLHDLRKVQIPLPPLPEQKKIAEILGSCDEAIEAQERLIAQKQQRKKGLMQQLLTGKKRFPQFAEKPWRSVKIGSLLKEVKRYVDWDDEERYQLLSLRRRSGGPFARESLFGSEIKTKTLKTIHAGDFLIAKMQVTHGALGLVTEDFDGWKVSDSYICMVPRDPKSFDVRFFNYLSQDRYIWHLAYIASYGVAIEKMTFVLRDFLKKEIAIPSTKEEASAIADCIDAVNQEITHQQGKLEQLKQQKKGLMQQLLTGKVRVAV